MTFYSPGLIYEPTISGGERGGKGRLAWRLLVKGFDGLRGSMNLVDVNFSGARIGWSTKEVVIVDAFFRRMFNLLAFYGRVGACGFISLI